jgi:Domain of unknown function (DUF4160)
MQVSVFSNDHPPPHIHVDFLDSKAPVRVAWPSLQSLKRERPLSSTERRDLNDYLALHQLKILKRVRAVFDPALPPAVGKVGDSPAA